ncbi:MAG: phenylalanine--tRNA ligase subunit alpha [Bacteroidota bacterium]|nr:phenylalanine--tRNA ligase subunit alpha [Bacteroidota bacterium]
MVQDRCKELINDINLFTIDSTESLETFRLKYLSKKSPIQDLFSLLKNTSIDERKQIGQYINDLKQHAEAKFEKNKELHHVATIKNQTVFDYTLAQGGQYSGSRHPLQITLNSIVELFSKLGFTISNGPELENDWHNFSALNFPAEHPARDMQDTFFINNDYALRTHTSSVQVRLMESTKPPIRSLMPGRVYRNEAISARANCFFHQVEGLYIDKDVSFADLKYTLYEFVKQFFNEEVKIRFRPSYFPFTEPSAEMDISCQICKGKGCNVCKHSGWVEILGCGMVDSQVLANCNINQDIYSGFAFGMGIERLTMLQYGISDLRIFFDNDLRFLKQFVPEN